MATTEEESWFGQTNKYKYQDLMIAFYEKDTIDLKVAHAKLGGTGVWIDTGRFTKGSRLEDMQKTTTHGDDIALYILSRMFNKHVFVYNSMYSWCTLPYQMEDNYQNIVDKCDLELVFLKCWALGEVKKI